MNIEARQLVREQKSRTAIIDVDIHPKASAEDLRPFLSARWWDHLQTYGSRGRQGFAKGFPYPKSQPLASRRDSWPPGGGLPASDLDFMRQQHLDFYGIEYAIMNPLSPTGQGDQNDDFSAAMAFAANEFQLEGWNRRDPRLMASVVVAVRGRGGVARRDQAAGGRSPLRPCAHAQPHRRPHGQEAVLADLRGGRGGRLSGRHPCVRHQRAAGEQFRLALVLYRGHDRARILLPGAGHQPDHGRRVRAPSGAQDRHDRSRLRLAAGARLAARQASGSACATRCRICDARRPNISGSTSGSRPSRWRRPRSRSICST